MTRRERRPASALPELDGDPRPGPEVNPVTVVEGQPAPGGYLLAVDQSAVLRPGIQDRPAAVRLGEQYCVQPGDARVGGGTCQVDFGFQAPRYAPPPDAHLRPAEPEPAFWGVAREFHRPRVGAAGCDDVLEVRAIAGHHRRPPGGLAFGGCPPGGRCGRGSGRLEVEPAELTEPARPGRAAVWAGPGGRGGRRWLRLRRKGS